MNEQEKKAIEELRKLPVTLLNCHLGGSVAIKTVLNLIEKQQKEIEELKEKNGVLQNELNKKIEALDKAMNNPDYISKSKIKEKINEYKNLINECSMNDEEIFCQECTEKCGFNQTIDVLHTLLEKE